MRAFFEGKSIQFKNRKKEDGDGWENTKRPTWSWDLFDYRIKPDEPKKPMTFRQLAELLAKGYGQTTYFYSDGTARLVGSSFEYEKDNEEDSVSVMRKIRPWGSDEWLDPTVDIYEEFMNRKEKERRYQNIKISIKKLNGDDFEVESEPEEDTVKDYSDASRIDPKVEEVFKYKGLTLKCVEDGNCERCALYFNDTGCSFADCRIHERHDEKRVVFVDVSKMERTTATEESSATVSKEESVGFHRRTPQEIADFFNCYVAMDKDGFWYLYDKEPSIGKGNYSWSMAYDNTGKVLSLDESFCFLLLNAEEDHNWRTLYRPHMEPLVKEEEDD